LNELIFVSSSQEASNLSIHIANHLQVYPGLLRPLTTASYLLHKDFDLNSLLMSSSCVMFADSANIASTIINVHLASHACGARLLEEYLSCVALSVACTRHAESIISACDVMI